VRIANDANCFALSEARDGAGQGAQSVFGVILGTGVGGGLVLDGALLEGASGLAGEWGHIPLPYFRHPVFAEGAGGLPGNRDARVFQLESRLSHRSCYCGRLNCIETYLSGPGLAMTHRELWRESRLPQEIAEADQETARQTLAVYSNMLARSLAQVVNLVDPQIIVLGGGLSNIESLYGLVGRVLPSFLFGFLAEGTEQASGPAVKPARWGDDSGVRGAAWLWDAND
jgi:fructokinase/N-acetylglucosamine kinase